MKVTTLISAIPTLFALTLMPIASPAQAQAPTPVPLSTTETLRSGESTYDYYMRIGYAAAQRDDYQTAAFYFRNALFEKPRDRDATIAYWNSRDAITKRAEGNNTAQPESAYDRYMEIGYDATESGDYQTALINFERALAERPNDYFATQAARNVKTYIQRGQGKAPAAQVTIPNFYPGELPYDRYMRLGYAAAQRQDHRTAADHFRSALNFRPNDRQATLAYWNAVDVLKGGKREQETAAAESAYDRYMRLGYDATERGAYQQALRRFQKALNERPGDSYASQAIRNVQTYIRQGQAFIK
ncbi:hypothetical protein [Acaryochloris sp. CCMEE 5410]|uniref:tetratricopeptide repeat protein n=1 Tax=Acaryochloris sp. CCMEE 5410 TaxID=310037 RepID=UPI0002484CBF|nr:hypothetical protein [Acaryochloris sp. CCMEE 5410]KAI9132324.1 hypothetical protein ON05_002285 [Acaryochloris sp. CCMEE 5410]